MMNRKLLSSAAMALALCAGLANFAHAAEAPNQGGTIVVTYKDDMATLKKFATADKDLRLDKVSLPDFELQVRKSMADDRKQQLVWGSSGAAFAQAVRMTQSEVTNYGLHVAKVLAETEPDPDRAAAMRKICAKWTAFHVEAYKLSK